MPGLRNAELLVIFSLPHLLPMPARILFAEILKYTAAWGF